ncbi:MAG TPA: hypothetical protein VGO93_30805 [Candidatus Xenobia bacterium]|jgi:hypothetical protein
MHWKGWSRVAAGCAVTLLAATPAGASGLALLAPPDAELFRLRYPLMACFACLGVLLVLVLTRLVDENRQGRFRKLVVPISAQVVSHRAPSKTAQYIQDDGPIDPTKLGMTSFIQRPGDASTRGGANFRPEDSRTAIIGSPPPAPPSSGDDEAWQQLLSKVSQDEPTRGKVDEPSAPLPPVAKVSIESDTVKPADSPKGRPRAKLPSSDLPASTPDTKQAAPTASPSTMVGPVADDGPDSPTNRKIDKSALRLELQKELDRGRQERGD